MRNFSFHLTYWLIACQEPRVEEEAFNEGLVFSEGYASLDGRFREDSGEDDDEDDEEVPPRSPDVDEKSACKVEVSSLVIRQLKQHTSTYNEQVLQALVTPNLRRACFMVSHVLFWKLGNTNFRIVQSHEEGDNAYIYIKMRKLDMRRFHGKRYEWMGEQVTFRKVISLMPLNPEPMEAGPVVKIF